MKSDDAQIKKIPSKILSEAKRGAKRRGIEFKITAADLFAQFQKQNGRCAFTKELITFGSSSSSRTTWNASLDRIDSAHGYVRGNIQWVTKTINMMKGRLNDSEFIKTCKLIAENNK